MGIPNSNIHCQNYNGTNNNLNNIILKTVTRSIMLYYLGVFSMKAAIPVIFCMLALSACNDNDPTSTTSKTGIFIDTLVKGLGYQTTSHQGKTNERGEFTYKEGEMITFNLDGLELGTTQAAAKVSVIALPQTQQVAQLLQTLDTDDSDELIDVSEIKLPDSIRNTLAAQLGGKHEDEYAFEEVLDAAGLQSIQAESGVILVNSTLVSETVSAAHVRNETGVTDWANSDLGGNLYMDPFSDGVAFVQLSNDDKSFIAVQDGESFRTDDSFRYPLEWNIDDNNEVLTLNLRNADGGYHVLNTELSAGQGAGDFDTYVDDLNDQTLFIAEFKKTVPITDIEGKHFHEDTSSIVAPECPGGFKRTYSFTTTEIINNTACYEIDGSVKEFFTYPYTRDKNPEIKNTISGTHSEDGKDFHIQLALFEGTFNGGLVTKFFFTDDDLTNIRYNYRFTEIAEPVTNKAVTKF